MNQFECLVHMSLHKEYEPHDVFASPSRVNHEASLILEEEPIVPFIPFPPPFLAPITTSIGSPKYHSFHPLFFHFAS